MYHESKSAVKKVCLLRKPSKSVSQECRTKVLEHNLLPELPASMGTEFKSHQIAIGYLDVHPCLVTHHGYTGYNPPSKVTLTMVCHGYSSLAPVPHCSPHVPGISPLIKVQHSTRGQAEAIPARPSSTRHPLAIPTLSAFPECHGDDPIGTKKLELNQPTVVQQ